MERCWIHRFEQLRQLGDAHLDLMDGQLVFMATTGRVADSL